MSKSYVLNHDTSKKVHALFAGEFVVAVVADGKVKFSNGNSEYVANANNLPTGTYRVNVDNPDTLTASEVTPPKPNKAPKVEKEEAPRTRSSGHSGQGLSMASLRR